MTSIRQRAVFIDFWQNLGDEKKESMVAMTEEMPLSHGFGLFKVFQELWAVHAFPLQDKKKQFPPCNPFNRRYAYFWWSIARITLSLHLAFWWQIQVAPWLLGLDNVYKLDWGAGHSGSYINDTEVGARGGVRICDYLTDKNGTNECMHLDSGRYSFIPYMVTAEFLVSACLTSIFAVTSTLLLSGCFNWLPESYPFVFFFVPRLAYTFNGLSGLQFLNVRRAESLFVRFEVYLWYELVRPQCCKIKCGKPCQPLKNCISMPFRYLIAILFSGICLTYSFQSLLIKMTMLHFATVRSFSTWEWHEWLLVLSFVNALAGAFDADVIEMHRILLLKFGGEDATWQESETALVASYFSMLSKRIVHDFPARAETEDPEGDPEDEGDERTLLRVDRSLRSTLLDRCRMLVVMALFNCQDMQRQLLCDKRAKQLKDSREARLALYNQFFGGDSASEFKNAIMQRGRDNESYETQVKQREKEWKRELNKLVAEVKPEEREGWAPKFKGIMIAEVENHIADVADEISRSKQKRRGEVPLECPSTGGGLFGLCNPVKEI